MFGKRDQSGVTFEEPKPKKKKWKIGWLILIAVVLLIVYGVISARKTVKQMAEGARALITSEAVTREDIEEYVNLSGTVVTGEKIIILSPTNAVVKDINVSYGDLVKKGDVLVTFDMNAMEKTLHQSKLQWEKSELAFESTIAGNSDAGAKLQEANTNLKVLNQQIADSEAYLKELQKQYSKTQRDTATGLATRSYELQQQLQKLVPGSDEYNNVSAQLSAISFQQSISGSSDYNVQMETQIGEEQERLAGYREYKARMEAQKSSSEAIALDSYAKRQLNIDRELAEIAYKQVEEAYEKAALGIVAEKDGVIDQIMVMKGSSVAEGMQLMNLNSTEALEVDISASKNMANKLAEGQSAEISINGRKYHGTVSRIDHMASVDSRGGVMLGTRLHIEDADDNILLGWDAKVKISVGRADNVLTLPLQTVYTDNDGDFVFVNQNGKAAKKYLTTGFASNGRIEIREGIGEGDTVLNDMGGILEEGMDLSAVLMDF